MTLASLEAQFPFFFDQIYRNTSSPFKYESFSSSK